jgi:hypothetical protein
MASLAVERYGFVESGYVTRAAAFEGPTFKKHI